MLHVMNREPTIKTCAVRLTYGEYLYIADRSKKENITVSDVIRSLIRSAQKDPAGSTHYGDGQK